MSEADTVTNPTRRTVLKTIAAGAAFAPFPRPVRAAGRSIKVATFGGYFEHNFIQYLYPEFEKATGIAVESMSEPGGVEFLVQVGEAVRAGKAPMDLCVAAQEDVARGAAQKLWRGFDPARIPALRYLDKRYVHEGEGGIDGIGGMSWFQTLIVNPAEVKPLPDSWKALWDAGRRDAWGLAQGGNSTLFEITAATWFGGTAILDNEDGIRQVIAKMGELRPNVKVWWDSEGTMQTAFENDEVLGGMYFNDVARVMAQDGESVVSIFPKEGAVMDFGSWCQPAPSTKIEEAQVFIDFMTSPASQATIARKNGMAPLIDAQYLDLSSAELKAVSGDTTPIPYAVKPRIDHMDFMQSEFTRMLAS